jgi:hypothetical protein
VTEQFKIVDFFLKGFLPFERQLLSLASEHLSSHFLARAFAFQQIDCCEASSSQSLERLEIVIEAVVGDPFL